MLKVTSISMRMAYILKQLRHQLLFVLQTKLQMTYLTFLHEYKLANTSTARVGINFKRSSEEKEELFETQVRTLTNDHHWETMTSNRNITPIIHHKRHASLQPRKTQQSGF